jgi:B12-binding domain/radical SAM domain protein
MEDIDLLLLHPPSVYDFRQHSILYGPISDLIPSSPVFEMYPLGFITMTSYLSERGFKVRVVNLALRMMNDANFDVPSFLKTLSPKAIGIDLHWLPHAHGSIEIARIAKEVHPNVPVIFGGFSSFYFHEELIAYPEIDYVFRGDSIEPPLHMLLQRLREDRDPDDVPNLIWKCNGKVRANPISFVPETMDYVDLRPDRMVEMVARYRDLESVVPFNGWLQNPITAVFTVKGCGHECTTCGSSRLACDLISHRQHPVFRTPESLIRNMRDISRIFRGPIFLVGDLFQAGKEYAEETLRLMNKNRMANEIIFELFELPPAGFLQNIDQCVNRWSLEISPESHDPAVRRAFDSTTEHSTEAMERIIQQALELRCNRVDVFFMIGLPKQTYGSVMETIDYCGSLFKNSIAGFPVLFHPWALFLIREAEAFSRPKPQATACSLTHWKSIENF